MNKDSTAKRIRDWAENVREKSQEFVFGPSTSETPRSAIIENRTAWRITLCQTGEAGIADSGGEAAAAPCADERLKTGGKAAPGELLILAPFAKRSLECALLNQFDYQSWERRGFVKIRPDDLVETRTGLAQLIHNAVWLIFIIVLILIALASPTTALIVKLFWNLIVAPGTPPDPAPAAPLVVLVPQLLPWLHWPILLASAAAVLIVDGPTIWKWTSQIVSFLGIVLISLLLTLGFFSLFTRNFASPTPAPAAVSATAPAAASTPAPAAASATAPAAASTPTPAAAAPANPIVVAQAGVAVVFFVVLASCIPALLYYLFQRQRSETARELFYRDAIQMSPNTYTLDEAEYRYGDQAEAVYGHKASQDFLGGLQVSLLVNLALTTLGWSLALMPKFSQLTAASVPVDAIPLLLSPLPDPIVFGALGAYFFALNMLFRRYVSGDLSPKAYTHVVVRQLTTVVLVWAVSVPNSLWKGLADFDKGGLLVLAFFIGVVPETALAIIQDYLRQMFTNAFRNVPALDEDQPLDALDGVTLYDRARLLEEGIENIENLAHNNLVELMLHTHLPTPRLVDLVDQAILYLHLFELPQYEPATDGAQSATANPSDGHAASDTAPAPDKTGLAGASGAPLIAPASGQNVMALPAPESSAPAGPAAASASAAVQNLTPAKANGADAGVDQGNGNKSVAPRPPATNGLRFSEAQRILRRYGIRTATDLEHARDLAYLRCPDEVPALLSLLDAGSPIPGRLQIVLDALDDDDWMPYLREWHWNRRAGQALTLKEIEGILTTGPEAKKKLALQAEPANPEPAQAAAPGTESEVKPEPQIPAPTP